MPDTSPGPIYRKMHHISPTKLWRRSPALPIATFERHYYSRSVVVRAVPNQYIFFQAVCFVGCHGQVGVQDFRSAWLELINVGICGLMNKAISAQYLYYICTFVWALSRNIRNRSKTRCYAKNLTTIKHGLRTSIIIQTLAKHTTVHCAIPGSKFTFSTNLFHHSLLSPTWTAFSDYTRPDLLCSTVFHF